MKRLLVVAGSVLVGVLLALPSYFVGALTGATYSPNYAPDMRFMGHPGYEASAQMGAVFSLGMMLASLCFALIFLRTLASRAVFLVATFLGLAFIPTLLFSTIGSRAGLLPLAYVGGGIAGAIIGFALAPR